MVLNKYILVVWKPLKKYIFAVLPSSCPFSFPFSTSHPFFSGPNTKLTLRAELFQAPGAAALEFTSGSSMISVLWDFSSAFSHSFPQPCTSTAVRQWPAAPPGSSGLLVLSSLAGINILTLPVTIFQVLTKLVGEWGIDTVSLEYTRENKWATTEICWL